MISGHRVLPHRNLPPLHVAHRFFPRVRVMICSLLWFRLVVRLLSSRSCRIQWLSSRVDLGFFVCTMIWGFLFPPMGLLICTPPEKLCEYFVIGLERVFCSFGILGVCCCILGDGF